MLTDVKITLNGDPDEIAGPLTVSALLARLDIDARRVAVEHNLVVLKRTTFEHVEIDDGDTVEIVNFVGGRTGRTATESAVDRESRRVGSGFWVLSSGCSVLFQVPNAARGARARITGARNFERRT